MVDILSTTYNYHLLLYMLLLYMAAEWVCGSGAEMAGDLIGVAHATPHFWASR